MKIYCRFDKEKLKVLWWGAHIPKPKEASPTHFCEVPDDIFADWPNSKIIRKWKTPYLQCLAFIEYNGDPEAFERYGKSDPNAYWITGPHFRMKPFSQD